PDRLEIVRLTTVEEAAEAIREMRVRGAPLIGVAAAYGIALGLRVDPTDGSLHRAAELLAATRPTAVNLRWALDRTLKRVRPEGLPNRAAAAYRLAAETADEDVRVCAAIGAHGERLLRGRWEALGRSRPVNVLTHCNAGWLATV